MLGLGLPFDHWMMMMMIIIIINAKIKVTLNKITSNDDDAVKISS